MIKFRCLLVFVFAALNNQQGLACFILFLSDGQRVLVGNHEDWFAKDAAIRIHSRMPGKYGAITFTFLSEGWPQGGMNERGLFFDAARTPLQEIEFSSDQKQYAGYIWQAVLDKCATVGEALNFLSQYQLPDLAESHVMLADSAGNAVVVGIDRGKVSVKRFKRNYLMQSNFSPWNPEACWRFEKAQQHLSIYPASSLDNMRNILEQTHQDSMTVYSNIYDLRNKTIYTYNKRNFSNPIVTSLPDLFRYGNCIQSLDAVNATDWNWNKCLTERPAFYRLTGKIIDRNNGHPLSYVNVGLFEQNIGTLSDPDGSFELEVPSKLYNDSVIFSSMGFDRMKVAVSEMKDTASVIKLNSSSIILKEVTVSAKRKLNKRSRLGWMGGDDGALPFDTIQGGGAIAILVESPTVPVFVEKLQVRLMYNSKDTLKLRFHLYAYDSVRQLPGRELLSKEIILKENKRFGWL
ncbi:MAG: carboxypeptidase-like regulatory domain-containing protein, partial [Bacteroidota bacterium]